MAYVPYQVPGDVDEQIKARQRRIAERRGVKLTMVSKSGDVLRELLELAHAAEQLNITASSKQAQP